MYAFIQNHIIQIDSQGRIGSLHSNTPDPTANIVKS